MTAHYTRYNQMFNRVMRLWEQYAYEYRTILGKYDELLIRKTALNIKPLNKISLADLELFPTIEFFEVTNLDEAEDFLLDLTERELERLNIDIDLYLDGYILRTLRNRIIDYDYELKRYEYPRRPFAMDPDACGARVKTRRKLKRTEDF